MTNVITGSFKLSLPCLHASDFALYGQLKHLLVLFRKFKTLRNILQSLKLSQRHSWMKPNLLSTSIFQHEAGNQVNKKKEDSLEKSVRHITFTQKLLYACMYVYVYVCVCVGEAMNVVKGKTNEKLSHAENYDSEK